MRVHLLKLGTVKLRKYLRWKSLGGAAFSSLESQRKKGALETGLGLAWDKLLPPAAPLVAGLTGTLRV